MTDERRQKRREIRLQQSESVWLQKALFALNKAEEAREKLADVRGEDSGAYTLPVGGSDLALEELQDALQERVEALLQTVRAARRDLR